MKELDLVYSLRILPNSLETYSTLFLSCCLRWLVFEKISGLRPSLVYVSSAAHYDLEYSQFYFETIN